MVKLAVVVACLVAAVVVPGNVKGMTDAHREAIREHMLEVAHACMAEVPLSEDEAASLKAVKMPDSENARCFVACMFKKVGILNEEGKMDKDGIMSVAEKMFSDAPEEIDSLKEFMATCSEVNAKDVSDGSKGCDRAKLAFECMNDHAAKFGFQLQ